MKPLDELIPIGLYAKNKGISAQDVVGESLLGELDLFYVFDAPCLVIYEPLSQVDKARGTKNNMVADEGYIEIEYLPHESLYLPHESLNLLYNHHQVQLTDLMMNHTPPGFRFDRMLDGSERKVCIDRVFAPFVKSKIPGKDRPKSDVKNHTDRPSTTGLKVVGLLMHHLAKSPKYASGTSPNKSQIKGELTGR